MAPNHPVHSPVPSPGMVRTATDVRSSHVVGSCVLRVFWVLACRRVYPYITEAMPLVSITYSGRQPCTANIHHSVTHSKTDVFGTGVTLVIGHTGGPICVNIQKKFQVPLSHSIGEKCDANFKLSSHFSRKLCDRGT